MLAGWRRQQQSRFLNEEATIRPRIALVRRFVEFTNAYPWQWGPADAEAFVARIRSANGRKPIAMSTGRGYETTLALFMEYVVDRRYGWPEACLERFGEIPQQIFHEDNRVAHVADTRGSLGGARLLMTRCRPCSTLSTERSMARGPAAEKGSLPPCGTRLSSRPSMPSGCSPAKRGADA
jgi:hypothetical protein